MNAIACNCSEENVPACVKRLWELDLMHVALMTRLVTMLCRVSASASTVKDMYRKKTRTLCQCIEEGLV